jgi:hypothetical protein
MASVDGNDCVYIMGPLDGILSDISGGVRVVAALLLVVAIVPLMPAFAGVYGVHQQFCSPSKQQLYGFVTMRIPCVPRSMKAAIGLHTVRGAQRLFPICRFESASDSSAVFQRLCGCRSHVLTHVMPKIIAGPTASA